MDIIDIKADPQSILEGIKMLMGIYTYFTGTYLEINFQERSTELTIPPILPDRRIVFDPSKYILKKQKEMHILNRDEKLQKCMQDFIFEKCILNLNYKISAKDLHNAFQIFCGEKVSANRDFPKIMTTILDHPFAINESQIHITKGSSRSGVIYYGLTLRENIESQSLSTEVHSEDVKILEIKTPEPILEHIPTSQSANKVIDTVVPLITYPKAPTLKIPLGPVPQLPRIGRI